MLRRHRYKTFKKRGRHNTRHFIIAVIVIIVVIFLLVKLRGRQDSAPPELADYETADAQPPIEQQQPQHPEIPEEQPVEQETVEPEVIETEGTETTSEQEQKESEPEQILPDQTEQDIPDLINPEAKALIAEALQDVNAGKIVAARDKLNQTLAMGLPPQIAASVKTQMAALSQKWLFSRDALPGDMLTELYEVQSGDLLAEIGTEYKVPYEILQQINNIQKPENLRVGQKIKVINGPFHAIVYSSTFTMDLYLQNTYVKSYKVGLGEEGKETPTGKWCVKAGGKLKKPTWTDPDTGRRYIADDPDYPLGSRWIALKGLEGNAEGRTGFAIHGTKDPDTIGTRSSKGCIRLFNGDAIELYNLVVPVDSKVNVVD